MPQTLMMLMAGLFEHGLLHERIANYMTTYVFCGQGSQRPGMGHALFDKFAEYVCCADEILGYSIKDLCLNDREHVLDNTQYTQPALFVVSMLEFYERQESHTSPDFYIGHSIGEYAALCAAEAFSFVEGLRIVKERGRLMGMIKAGGMAAIIGISSDEVHEILNMNALESIDIANYNSFDQTVISGPAQDIIDARAFFIDSGARAYLPLKVSGAFHSRYMLDVQQLLGKFIQPMQFCELTVPVISNYTAREYEKGKTKNTLLPQISQAVRWVDSIRYLMSYTDMKFVPIGPGNTTSKLVKSILKAKAPFFDSDSNRSSVPTINYDD